MRFFSTFTGSLILSSVLYADHPMPSQTNEALYNETIAATVKPLGEAQADNPADFLLTLTEKESGEPITFDDLEVAHTERVHLLIVDQSLEDYHHIHPQEGEEPGTYPFSLTPENGGTYRLFADLLPIETGEQEYATATFSVKGEPKPLEKWESQFHEGDEYRYRLSFRPDGDFALSS